MQILSRPCRGEAVVSYSYWRVHVHIADHVVARLLLQLLAGVRAHSGPCRGEAVVTVNGGCTCR